MTRLSVGRPVANVSTPHVGDKPAVKSIRSTGVLVASWAVAGIGWFVVIVGPVATQLGWLNGKDILFTMRGYAPHQQLTYLAISTNVANDLPALTEPFTATGDLFYPPGYYLGLGVVSRALQTSPITTWNLVGLAVSLGVVAFTGLLAFKVVKRPWAPILGLTPLLAGTLSTVFHGNWHVTQQRHAVIAAPLTSLYALNAEVAGYLIGAIGLALIIRPMFEDASPLYPTGRYAIVGFALVGVTASVHTYAFLSTATIAVVLFAIGWLRDRGTHRDAATTILLGIAAVPLGQVVAGSVGNLAAFSVVALPLAPALLLAAKDATKNLVPFGALALTASPQLVKTVIGVLDSDPFLTYRQGSTQNLDVKLFDALFFNLPLLLLVLFAAFPVRHRTLQVGRLAAISIAVSWAVLSFNRFWGFDQEPYRFSVATLLIATIVLPGFAARRWLEVRAKHLSHRRAQQAIGALLVISLLLGIADVPAFWTWARDRGFIDRTNAQALEQLAEPIEGEFLLLDPCIDPHSLKVETGARIAHFRYGVAFPESAELRAAIDARLSGRLKLELAKQGGVTRVLIRGDCGDDWSQQLEDDPQSQIVIRTDSDPEFILWSTDNA